MTIIEHLADSVPGWSGEEEGRTDVTDTRTDLTQVTQHKAEVNTVKAGSNQVKAEVIHHNEENGGKTKVENGSSKSSAENPCVIEKHIKETGGDGENSTPLNQSTTLL